MESNLAWLLDPAKPGVRYLALRHLLRLPAGDPELQAACRAAHTSGPIAAVLEHMHPEGWWERPGPGYNPKYFSLVWSLILLSQLGARVEEDERIGIACTYLLDHALTPHGQFTATGAPSGTIDCLQGNLCASLAALGCQDPRLEDAFDWLTRSVTGIGVAPAGEKDAPLRWYAYKCGPGFACGVNGGKPCAWGAVKVAWALGLLPEAKRTPQVEEAIRQVVEFLLGVNPASALYPTARNTPPSRSWWKFGFPVFYVTDILQVVEVLSALGWGDDPRLANALQLLRSRQDVNGRLALTYDYAGKTWVGFGPKDRPNPWVTLRLLRALQNAGSAPK